MRLDETQAIQVIKEPKNRKQIDSIKMYESQLRVFTEELDSNELSKEPYWGKLMKEVEMKIDKKFKRISQYVRFPLPVVQITDSILNDYFKVFDGKNRFFNIDSDRDIKTLNNWVDEIKPQRWIENEAKDVMKNKPSSIVVIDRHENGTPYLLNIDVSRLVDFDVKDDSTLEYIVFIHSIEGEGDSQIVNYAVYDDSHYRVISKVKSSDAYNLEKQIPHNIGYCPARMFVTSKANSKNPLKRRIAFGPSLAKLEDWTVFDIFRNYIDHYVPFPVTESPIKKCANTRCKGGKVDKEIVVDAARGTKETVWSVCPVCEGKDAGSLIGPGTHIGIKLKANKDQEDGSDKFKMHFPETEKIKYTPEKLRELELEIKYKTVGISDVLQKEAVNEIQVKGSFSSMESILLRNKIEYDQLNTWIVKTAGFLYYKNVNLVVESNFGTEWYLLSEEQLQIVFENAKKIGLPKAEQVLIYEQLIDTKYKGNAEKIARQKLLLRLDPLPLYGEKEAIEMYEKNVIDHVTLNFKINFYRFVKEFEDQNMVITEFGSNLEYNAKVKIILTSLKKLNDENITSKPLGTGDEGNQGD